MKRPGRHFRRKTILIDMRLRKASDRDVLGGIFQYADSVSGWNVKLRLHDENPLTADMIRSAPDNGITGFIICEPEPSDMLDTLAESELPIVTVGFGADLFRQPPKLMAAIKGDNEALGAMGAKHLMSLGRFRSFAFVGESWPERRYSWSERRCNGFGNLIKKHGWTFNFFMRPEISADTIPELATWLSDLPKPVAIMTACDRIAVLVIDACDSAHMRIPDQAAVLGADNDEFLCSHSSPPLLSILPWHKEMGFRAAEELDRLMSGRKQTSAKVVVLRPVKIVERESTAAIAPAAQLVERAKAFIQQNACSGITVKDVVAHLHVSRRLAELRYKAIAGECIGEAIQKVRLARVKRLLVSSRRSIDSIASESGFRRPNNLAHLFKKRFAMTMSEFRHRNRPCPIPAR